ncbi:MAG: hypothetical protein J6X02_03105, partial [Bacilli bacterium]|nr:hypothetical protein [Bacilli bacterium]
MNNSLLYKYLEEKYRDESSKNKVLYHKQYEKDITVSDLYLLVYNYIDIYKKNRNIDNYILVQNDIDSIARLIALLELGYSPILLNGDDFYIKNTIHPRMITGAMIDNGEAMDKHEIIGIDHEKLNKKLEEIKNSKIINTPGVGKIGIFSSGTLSEPKLIYLDEGKIIDNIQKSKNIFHYRNIYNPLPLNSISGLFTNVFLPICSNYVEANIIEQFDSDVAIECTDLFLPRNYRELFLKYDKGKIRRVYIFGETNSKETIEYLNNNLTFDKIAYINVYGLTEMGGLVSEYDITNAKQLFIYDYDIEKDMIIYSYDKIHFYKNEKDNISELTDEEINEINKDSFFNVLPCGTSDDVIKIDNTNIGEGHINNYKTGDIFISLDNKIYILGRKDDLKNHTSLPYLDNKVTNLIGYKCTTFIQDDDIYLAVKYNLDKDESSDNTFFFRRLIKKSKELEKKIKSNFPMIKDVLFIPNELYPLSNNLKKAKRKDFNKLLEYYEKIRYRLNNYDECLTNYFKKMCSYYLDFIPSFTLDSRKNIIIPYDQINEEQLIKLLEPLRIIGILKKDDIKSYKIYYCDSYFFGIKDTVTYTDEKIKQYQELSKHHLFI